MSIYFGNQQISASTLNTAAPVGLEEICNHTFVSGAVVYNGDRIYAGTFARTPITSFSGPNVKRFNHVADPNTDGSGIYTFIGCTNLVSVNFPELLNPGTSGSSQFNGCTSLTTLNFPKLTTFGSGGYTFANCTALTTINSTQFPALTTFNAGGYHFQNCTSLVTVDLPNLTAFGAGGYHFQGCTALTTVNLPNVTGAPGNYSFSGCTALEHIYLPKFNPSGTYSFNGCNKLLTAVLPYKQTTAVAMGGNTFRSCSKLTSVDLGNLSQIKANEFYNATVMNILVLRRSSVTTLANVSAFAGTPFASGKAGGTLYVPEALLSSYQTASNWSTIFNYGSGTQNSFKTIESTHTDPTAPIDLTLYYVDGTPIA